MKKSKAHLAKRGSPSAGLYCDAALLEKSLALEIALLRPNVRTDLSPLFTFVENQFIFGKVR